VSGQHYNINIASKYLENVADFRYLETKITNQNHIHEKIKSRLNMANACYQAVHYLVSSSLAERLKYAEL
jgi:hypothetical protein